MEDNELIGNLTIEELTILIRHCVRKELLGEYYRKEIDEKLLSATEVKKLFQPELSRSTMSRWEKTGLLPVRKILGTRYYKRSEILAALDQKAQTEPDHQSTSNIQ